MLRPRTLIPTLVGLAAALALAPAALATTTEIGATGDKAVGTPSCPTNCIAVTRTTGYQQTVGNTAQLYRVPRDGTIVAWTVTLGTPNKKQISFFDENYGGEAQAGLAVLEMGKKARARTVALSPIVKLTPWFGKSAQFALATTIPVKKDQMIALTVPTWAPTLAVGLGADSAWRASRTEACKDQATTQLQTAQTLNQLTQYNCKYATARLTYSATLISTP
jgi:hypothetical protein